MRNVRQLHTLSKLYDVPVGFLNPTSPHLRQCIQLGIESHFVGVHGPYELHRKEKQIKCTALAVHENLLFFPMQFIWPVNTDKNAVQYLYLHLLTTKFVAILLTVTQKCHIFQILNEQKVRHLEQPSRREDELNKAAV